VDKRYLNSLIDPQPFKLLGRKLYPWCLKYRVRLIAFESPLAVGGRDITPADLLFACQVCAEETLGEVRWVDKLRLMRLNENPAQFKIFLNAFAGYILVENWPKLWESNKKSGGDGKVPWPLMVVANLIANGIDEKRAWEMPECQAIWYNAAFAIRKGVDVSIMSPDEEAFIESQLKAKTDADPAAAVANPAG